MPEAQGAGSRTELLGTERRQPTMSVNRSAQAMRTRSGVAGLCTVKSSARSLSLRAAATASAMAKNTEDPRNIPDSPRPCKKTHLSILFIYLFFSEKVSLCGRSWPHIHPVDQVELTETTCFCNTFVLEDSIVDHKLLLGQGLILFSTVFSIPGIQFSIKSPLKHLKCSSSSMLAY